MNANWQPKMLAIKDWLDSSSQQLSKLGIKSSKLDVEMILSHTLRKPRTYLHAHPEEQLSDRQKEIADARLDLRLERVPVAYIIGHRDFYGRHFKVTPATLIPRPESEDLIDITKEIIQKNELDNANLIDVGTGSGCLGITLNLEIPTLKVTLLDISNQALMVAKKNASLLGATVDTLRSDLLKSYPLKPGIVVANLPYVDKTWERSPETNHEPELALFAKNNGKDLIFKLIDQASSVIASNGILILEADTYQHEEIKNYAKSVGFEFIKTKGYTLGFSKT